MKFDKDACKIISGSKAWRVMSKASEDYEYEPKEVIQKDMEKKGKGLLALVDIMEGDYIIEYVGTIVKERPDSIYRMKYCFFDLWVEA
jgi:hypothetical protein